MSDVSSVAVITLRTIRDALSTRTYKRKHTHLSARKYTLPLHKSNKPYSPNQEHHMLKYQNQTPTPSSNTHEEPYNNQSLQHHQQYQQSSDTRIKEHDQRPF
jgi:hypothetical protein